MVTFRPRRFWLPLALAGALGLVAPSLAILGQQIVERRVDTSTVNDFADLVSQSARDRLNTMLRSLKSASKGVEFTILTYRLERDFIHPLGFNASEIAASAEKVWKEFDERVHLEPHIVLIVVDASPQIYVAFHRTKTLEDELPKGTLQPVVDTLQPALRSRAYDTALLQATKMVTSNLAVKRGFSTDQIEGYPDPFPWPAVLAAEAFIGCLVFVAVMFWQRKRPDRW